ncbi:DUF4178 domain-containing protein [Mycobacterium sp.]|uniref:DUF4178 domain-containing protein n=1 Tax=Mycobacterium sp. TaxID=1785 RepID=UPI003BA9DFDC
MGTLLVLAALGLLVASIVIFRKALRQPKNPAQPAGRQDPLSFSAMPEFGPRRIGPGAIVSYGGVDYVVRGSVTFREGPFVWWEHLLEGGNQPIWFSVEEEDGRLELAAFVKRADLELEPGGRHQVDGVIYRESERGSAGYTTEGTTGLPPGGEMYYVDYTDNDETSLLSFERWAPNMPWEISTGKCVLPGELTVYPAPPAPA